MEIYVIRHGIAEDAGPGLDDQDRELTVEGRRRFRRVVRGLDALGVRFERVLHSPWARAAQTAELLEPLTSAPLEPLELLAREPSAALCQALSRHTDEGALAVVGHQPWLTELAGWLCFDRRGSGEAIDLKKGGVLWLEGEPAPGRMKLRAHLTPRMLRALARRGRGD